MIKSKQRVLLKKNPFQQNSEKPNQTYNIIKIGQIIFKIQLNYINGIRNLDHLGITVIIQTELLMLHMRKLLPDRFNNGSHATLVISIIISFSAHCLELFKDNYSYCTRSNHLRLKYKQKYQNDDPFVLREINSFIETETSLSTNNFTMCLSTKFVIEG